MDTAKIQAWLKENWHIALGAIIGLYLVWRYMAGSSSSGDPNAAYYAYASQANAQQLQASAQAAQIEVQREANAIARETAAANAQIGFLNSQANMAQAVSRGAAEVVGSLYAPTIAAINSAGYENAAALSAAATVAGAGFMAQADMVGHTSSVVAAVSNATRGWEGVSQGVGTMFQGYQSPTAQIGQAVAQGVAGGYGNWSYAGSNRVQ